MKSNNEPQGGSKRKGVENEIKAKAITIFTAVVGAVGTCVTIATKDSKNPKRKSTAWDIIKNTTGKKKHR